MKYIIIPRSGVVRTQLEELVSRENIIIHIDSIHMGDNLGYTADPCGYIENIYSWTFIGNTK
jgi:hypothetical protein